MLEIIIRKDSNNQLIGHPSNFEVIQKIHSESLDWSNFDSKEVPIDLFTQLHRGGTELHYNLDPEKYLDVVVKALSCHLLYTNTNEFNIYCNDVVFQILENKALQNIGFIVPISAKTLDPHKRTKLKIDLGDIILTIHAKGDIKTDCIVCFSINGNNNIAEVKVKNTDKLAYCLIDPTNSLLIKFKH